jgi:hypothetical protein
MFSSYRRAGTGIVFCECRDEAALLVALRRESNGRPISVHYATDGPILPVNQQGVIDTRIGDSAVKPGLANALAWATDRAGDRILVIFDLGGPVNNPGIWRRLISALPALRSSADGKNPLVICASPSWQLSADNPLRGLLPILSQPVATRDEIRAVLRATSGAPALGDDAPVLDALAGLTCAAAEQVAAESVVANEFRWVPGHLRAARKAALKDGGLEIRPAVQAMGGLANLQDFFRAELLPWAHDRQLAPRRLLFGGVPGVGKSFAAAGLAGAIGCECVELSPERCKAGIVGQSGANFRRALRTIDALAADAPLVVLIDEIDLIATDGLDGGASAGLFQELCGWLDNRDSLAVVCATLNRVDKLNARLDSRFPSRWIFDLPCAAERREIAEIHLRALGAADPVGAAELVTRESEGFSARELATELIPTILRRSNRAPDGDVVRQAAREILPTSKSQSEQIELMRRSAAGFRPAGRSGPAPTGPSRRVG